MAAPKYQNARWFIAGATVAAVLTGTAYFLDRPYLTAAEAPAANSSAVTPAPANVSSGKNRVTNTTTITKKKSRES